ncbi:hypothetical protein [Moraxella lacunata]|jgi:hypothetical protein|nr:hypothetical protein [Moraxella lacunata]DAP86855.1 MAG TPA: hypothetical protein [Caudoviricetes sp.]
MTDPTTLDEELKMAEIHKMQAETARITMEAEKLRAETQRLAAETAKINAESLKLQKDAKWHPWLAIILASVAIVVALIK